MNEIYEQDIDLKWLLYRVLRAWRTIVVWGIVTALVVGIGSFTITSIKRMNPENKTAQQRFEEEHASWVNSGATLEMEIENLQKVYDEQKNYNENSILMQINPLREYNASFELYVDYDNQMNPSLTDLIINAYATYLTNDEMYQNIIDQLSFSIEKHYFNEIFSVSTDYLYNMISISVRHNADRGQEILSLVSKALQEKYASVCETIADHTLREMNATSYEAKNYDLESSQKANKDKLSELDIALREKKKEYQEWEKVPEPKYQVFVAGIIKTTLKRILIAGFIGALAVALVVTLSCTLSSTLLNPEDMKKRFRLRVIGELPCSRTKKPFAFVSRLVAKFGGVRRTPEEYEMLAKVISADICSELASRENAKEWKQIAFTGMVGEEEMNRLLTELHTDETYTFISAANILTNAESIQKVATADCVVLVEKQEVTKIADIEKELQALKAWHKTILGAVVLNTDAVM